MLSAADTKKVKFGKHIHRFRLEQFAQLLAKRCSSRLAREQNILSLERLFQMADDRAFPGPVYSFNNSECAFHVIYLCTNLFCIVAHLPQAGKLPLCSVFFRSEEHTSELQSQFHL